MAEQEASAIKQVASKVMDTAGGVIGRIGSAVTVPDDGFGKSAVPDDRYEVRSARIAFQRSRAGPPRAAALLMIADHTASTHHLQAALGMKETGGIAPPAAELGMHDDIRTGTNPQQHSVALSGGPVFKRHLEHMKVVRAAL